MELYGERPIILEEAGVERLQRKLKIMRRALERIAIDARLYGSREWNAVGAMAALRKCDQVDGIDTPYPPPKMDRSQVVALLQRELFDLGPRLEAVMAALKALDFPISEILS